MFRVAVCDDQKQIVEQLSGIVTNILSDLAIEYSLEGYYDGDKLLQADKDYDLVFLDIEMPGLDGIEVGKLLKQNHNECKIVMATSLIERYKDAFKISAFRFVTKPFVVEEIKEALTSAVEFEEKDESIELYYQRIPCDILLKDIQYIRAYNGYSEYLVGNRIFRSEQSLSSVEKMLDPRYFVRVHRQFIVNMRWIKDYECGKIEIGDEVIPVSKRKCKEFEQEYIKFDLMYNRSI